MFAYLLIVVFLGAPTERPLVMAPAQTLAACDAAAQELQTQLNKEEGSEQLRPTAVCYKAYLSTKM
jgi:hypothetical protein